MKLKDIINDLRKRNFESTWYDFKENKYNPDEIGQYISALSNAALLANSDFGYLIWGIKDAYPHDVCGTTFNYEQEVNHEGLEHYLARSLSPKIHFSFNELTIDNKRVVVLKIPSAKEYLTSYKDERYIRIGSSKESLRRYPEREAALWFAINHKDKSLETIESDYQELTFNSLINYYATKGINLNLNTFKENLGLLTSSGQYNLLAQLLSDNSQINIRVAIFAGKTKADPMFSVKEFGKMNLLLSLEKVLDYGDTFNIPQANERDRIVERKDVDLFSLDAYREAVINAFVHNDWTALNAPMFTFYSDRIEILSHGPLSPKLSIEDFYKGKSEPINRKLSDIFLQLHLSERTGRGVPIILDNYGKEAFEFASNWIQVTIPFNFIKAVDYNISKKVANKAGQKVVNKQLSKNQAEIVKNIRNNANITVSALSKAVGIGHTAIQNNLNYLQEIGIIIRHGARKNGYWEVVD